MLTAEVIDSATNAIEHPGIVANRTVHDARVVARETSSLVEEADAATRAPWPGQQEEAMASRVRRVVTGHDTNGRAVVKIDDQLDLVSRAPGTNVTARVLWTTESFPVDNTGDDDTAPRATGLTLEGGTVFRVVEFGPGNAPRMHRTDSIDYAVVISGEIDMELDDSVVHLKTGDVLVQRGTIHNWVNKGAEPCTIAFILIDAAPVTVAGKVLNAVG